MTWKDEFLAIVSAPVLPTDETAKAWQLKHENMPRSLFRYRSLSPYVPGEIANDTVRLMSPDRYNDPFDSLFLVSHRFADKSLWRMMPALQKYLTTILDQTEIDDLVQTAEPMQALIRKMAAHSPFKTEAERAILIETITQLVHERVDSMTHSLSQSLREKFAISCFSERNDSILMWSHYASHHQGVCIEYPIDQMAEDDICRRMMLPVFYKENLFDGADVIAHQGNPFVQLLACMHKAPEWSYEREWRLVIPMPVGPTGQDYRVIKPRAIYLGAKYSAASQDAAVIAERIRETAKARNIELHQMSMVRNAFRLEAAQIA